jgi:transposase InsO family protein
VQAVPTGRRLSVAHRRAKLTPFGRLLLVQRVTELGWSATEAAKAASVSRATVYKWLRRYREEGEHGLGDRSSRAKRCPHALPPPTVARILRARRRLRQGPHRLAYTTGVPRSTIYGILRRHGLSRLSHTDRPTGAPIRYERARPGELVHIDVKKLGRIPPGGGHRIRGRTSATRRSKNRGGGYDYLHAAVDDHSRAAYVEVHPDERGETCARFLANVAAHFAERGILVQQVMTDNAFNYVNSIAFQEALAAAGARHVRIPPYRPRANGKVERFNRTMLEEWAYVRLYRSNRERLAAFRRWLAFYNSRRPHTALGGKPPASRL